MENAGIKVHMWFSNAKGVISHLTITEGTGSERAQVRAEEYGAGLKNTLDLGYVNYDGGTQLQPQKSVLPNTISHQRSGNCYNGHGQKSV
jgi:hypothetical protein